MQEFETLIETINKYGITGVLALMVVALALYITRRTVPREIYDEARSDVDEVRTEMRELIAPALDSMTELHKRELALQEEMWHHIANHSHALQELSKEVRLISHEMTMQRLKPARRSRQEDYVEEDV
ncbi:MAG: hypothetical protein E6J26_02725 [Chloroflexi bacterium]|nr:MAG: hypothetical protein E6J26_02725 [Chloroflexota bacterium]